MAHSAHSVYFFTCFPLRNQLFRNSFTSILILNKQKPSSLHPPYGFVLRPLPFLDWPYKGGCSEVGLFLICWSLSSGDKG